MCGERVWVVMGPAAVRGPHAGQGTKRPAAVPADEATWSEGPGLQADEGTSRTGWGIAHSGSDHKAPFLSQARAGPRARLAPRFRPMRTSWRSWWAPLHSHGFPAASRAGQPRGLLPGASGQGQLGLGAGAAQGKDA